MAAVSLVAPAAGWAHPAGDDRLTILERRLLANPCDAGAWLARSRVLQEQHQGAAADEALRRAEHCAPGRADVELARGELLLRQFKPGNAETHLSRYLDRHPESGPGHLARARARVVQGKLDAAVADYDRALALLASPQPDHYLERARQQVAIGDVDAALRGLDQGAARLGPVPVLEQLAVALEVEVARYDAALLRVDAVLKRRPGSAWWLLRRAEVLLAAGRRDQAHAAFERALARIEAGSRRRSDAVLALGARAQAGLAASRAGRR